jgi:photosystem II stability/assembly factor-like uncharacterized protein
MTVTSTDGGATFHPSATFGPASGYLAGAASAQVLFADTDRLYRSADGGATWQPVSLGAVARPQAFVIRFTTATTGIVLVRDAAGAVSPTIWATTDAGSTWHARTFP